MGATQATMGDTRPHAAVVLEHVVVHRHGRIDEHIAVARDLVVWHHLCGVVRVPADHRCFSTDLASVPWFWRWVVGRVGVHLRAAVVHDWLIHQGGHGGGVSRADADRVFAGLLQRDGVDPVTRWLMVAAVGVATAIAGGHRPWMRPWVPFTMVAVVVAGVLTVLSAGPWWPPVVAVPAAGLGATWHPIRREGMVALVATALLWPATLAVLMTGAALSATRCIIRRVSRADRR